MTKFDEKWIFASVTFPKKNSSKTWRIKKKPNEENPEKVDYRRTDGGSHGLMDKHEFHRTSVAGGPKKIGLYDRSLTCTVLKSHFPVRVYFFKVNNGNSRTISEI